jgi:hypothetical protein
MSTRVALFRVHRAKPALGAEPGVILAFLPESQDHTLTVLSADATLIVQRHLSSPASASQRLYRWVFDGSITPLTGTDLFELLEAKARTETRHTYAERPTATFRFLEARPRLGARVNDVMAFWPNHPTHVLTVLDPTCSRIRRAHTMPTRRALRGLLRLWLDGAIRGDERSEKALFCASTPQHKR